MSKQELYISFDVEADGPCPGLNSMLSLGCAAYAADGKLVDTFYVNLVQLEDAVENLDTMEWWSTQPDAWKQARKDLQTPQEAMEEFQAWLANLGQEWKPTPVAYPAGFDWPFLYYYCHRFLGHSPMGFACVDMKSMAMMLMETDYRHTAKRRMPTEWFNAELVHDHNALNDAVEQGYTFIQMLKEKKEVSRIRKIYLSSNVCKKRPGVVEVNPPTSD